MPPLRLLLPSLLSRHRHLTICGGGLDQIEDRECGEGSDEALERSTTTSGRDMSSSAFALNERGSEIA